MHVLHKGFHFDTSFGTRDRRAMCFVRRQMESGIARSRWLSKCDTTCDGGRCNCWLRDRRSYIVNPSPEAFQDDDIHELLAGPVLDPDDIEDFLKPPKGGY